MSGDLTAEPRVRDLLRPENHLGAPAGVELRFTHGSVVFLTDDAVFKIKRAKDYGFFDYTTLAARRHFCDEEVRLNRRAAPDVYLGVVPVYRDERGWSFNRPGEVVDWAVHMRRLPDDRTALALLERGALGEGEVAAIAAAAARFYRRVEVRPCDPGAMRENVEENFAQVEPFVGKGIDDGTFERTRELQRRWLEERGAELAARPCRDGHGDLRLEHVYLLDGEVLFLDCIEFLERFRVGDPALDAAFLAMDLRRLGRSDLAEALVARFAYESDDYGLYPLIDGYVSYRAFVRGKVACLVAGDPATPAEVAARKRAEAAALFALALDALAAPRPQPVVVAVGGLIAAGKTSVAGLLARRLRAPVVSADATRKHLAGLDRDERGGAEIYTAAFNARVHDDLLRRIGDVLHGRRAVIVDTTFRSRALRARVRAAAARAGARFVLVECRAPETELRRRLRARQGGVSDAREDLLDAFLAGYEPVTELAPSELIALDTTLPEPGQLEALRAGGLALP